MSRFHIDLFFSFSTFKDLRTHGYGCDERKPIRYRTSGAFVIGQVVQVGHHHGKLKSVYWHFAVFTCIVFEVMCTALLR